MIRELLARAFRVLADWLENSEPDETSGWAVPVQRPHTPQSEAMRPRHVDSPKTTIHPPPLRGSLRDRAAK